MGSGYKTFTAGAVLTASDVQNYLQDQSVMVFGGTAARSSAIGTANFEEGMLTYLTDVDKLQVYTGATFADVYPPATSNQGLTLINTTAFSAVASQVLTNVFSATYENYRFILDINGVSASQDITIRLRTSGGSDATTNYTNVVRVFDSDGGSGNMLQSSQWKVMETRSASNNHFYTLDMDIHSPFLAVPTTHTMQSISRASAGASKAAYGGGMHEDATSYPSLSILANTGNITGKAYIYGYNL